MGWTEWFHTGVLTYCRTPRSAFRTYTWKLKAGSRLRGTESRGTVLPCPPARCSAVWVSQGHVHFPSQVLCANPKEISLDSEVWSTAEFMVFHSCHESGLVLGHCPARGSRGSCCIWLLGPPGLENRGFYSSLWLEDWSPGQFSNSMSMFRTCCFSLRVVSDEIISEKCCGQHCTSSSSSHPRQPCQDLHLVGWVSLSIPPPPPDMLGSHDRHWPPQELQTLLVQVVIPGFSLKSVCFSP